MLGGMLMLLSWELIVSKIKNKLWTVTHREIYTTVVLKSFINVWAATKDDAYEEVCNYFYVDKKKLKKIFKSDFQISEHKELDDVLGEVFEQRKSTTPCQK
jgi:hypothetical protein